MSSHEIVLLVVGLLGSGGFIAAVVAFFKLRPETGQILVTTAQGVVIVQTGIIQNLQTELARVSTELEEVRQQRDADVKELRGQLAEVIQENGALRKRIRELERHQT